MSLPPNVIAALTEKLPAEMAAPLAVALEAYLAGRSSTAELAGQLPPQTLLEFGNGNQIGAVQVGERAGRDIIHSSRDVRTGGGDYAEGVIDKRSGVFATLTLGSISIVLPASPPRPHVPACPPPNAARLVGRQDFLDTLVQRLLGGGAAVTAISALRGLPGVGKTDLLRALGHDARIAAHFADGVLYAEPGPSPDGAQILRRWISALGHEPPRSDDRATLADAARALLAPRCVLLLIDDVWEGSMDIAAALRDCAGPACRVLASSRSADVAQALARGAPPLTLATLTPDAALELLRQSAPRAVEAEAAQAAALAQALGYLPLALKLAGGLLDRLARRSPSPVADLLASWHTRLADLRGYETRPAANLPISNLCCAALARRHHRPFLRRAARRSDARSGGGAGRLRSHPAQLGLARAGRAVERGRSNHR